MTTMHVSSGIAGEADDLQAGAVVPPAFLVTYDSPLVDDVVVDSHSVGVRQPCGWRRRQRSAQPSVAHHQPRRLQ